MEMPTIEQLINRLKQTNGVNIEYWQSVSYGDSRTVLNHTDKKVLAYGIGVFGFVAIYPMKYGFAQAVSFSIQHAFDKYSKSAFMVLDNLNAIDIIKTAPFTDKKIDEVKLNEALDKKRFARPIIGEITIKDKSQDYYDTNTYRVYGLKKKGRYRVERLCSWMSTSFNRKYHYIPLNCFANYLEDINKKKSLKVLENTVPKEVLDKIKMTCMMENL